MLLKNITIEEIDFIIDLHTIYKRTPSEGKDVFEWWLHYETELFTHKSDGIVYFSLSSIPELYTIPKDYCVIVKPLEIIKTSMNEETEVVFPVETPEEDVVVETPEVLVEEEVQHVS